MMKCGDIHKSWKNRFFVALNEADNFRIDYFESEGGKLKGSMNLCGYSAQHYSADEAKEHGSEFGIKLVPWDDRRRTWWLKCTSEEDRSDWMNVFRTACYKSHAPLNQDPLIAKAFKTAYRATRWSYGYYGWYTISGTEGEQLGGLVYDILERELLREVYDGIPAGPTRYAVISSIRKSVDAAVTAAVSAAWNAGLQACESMKSTLVSAVKQALAPIFEKEVGIKEKITNSISGKINPFLADVGGRVCTPIFRTLSTPVTKAFAAAVRGFAAQMKGKIEVGTLFDVHQHLLRVRVLA